MTCPRVLHLYDVPFAAAGCAFARHGVIVLLMAARLRQWPRRWQEYSVSAQAQYQGGRGGRLRPPMPPLASRPPAWGLAGSETSRLFFANPHGLVRVSLAPRPSGREQPLGAELDDALAIAAHIEI